MLYEVITTPLFQVLLVQLDQALSSAGQLRVEGQRTPEASDLMAVTDDSLSLEKLKKAGDETVQYDLEVYVRETPEGLRVNFVRITSYNVCYTKLLRSCSAART